MGKKAAKKKAVRSEPEAEHNLLLYGDNLDFLRDADLLRTASVDLIYLDPPFNSNADYNVLFKDAGGEQSAAQIKAFEDTWSWDAKAAEALAYLMQDKHTSPALAALIKTFHTFLGHSPMLAYLVQMAIRLVHMRRVLKESGSLYLHCDPTASHYLKLILDAIFGSRNFLNEVVWYYRGAGVPKSARARRHDILLHYAANEGQHYFNPDPIRRPYADATVERFSHYIGNVRDSGDYGLQTLNPLGKHPDDVITHIQPIAPSAKARLGYPTQKPIELLREVVAASSKPGDVVLDPFCGCGTTIDAVEELNRENPTEAPRRWIGIDITHLAINLIKFRLSRYDPPVVYDVRGEPRDIEGARQLFSDDAYQFQFWACGLVGARPAGASVAEPKKGKKGADRGIDGQRMFMDREMQTILVQVKGGRVGAAQVRDFVGTIGREGAAMGIFVTLDEPTKPMLSEAATAGVYTSPLDTKVSVPKVQIVTVATLMAGGSPRQPNGIQLPPFSEFDRTLKKADSHEGPTLFAKRR